MKLKTHYFFTSFYNKIKTKRKLAVPFALVCLVYCFSSIAQTYAQNTANTENNDVLHKIVPIGNEYQNSIKLLDNRFRIDSDVQEVTIVFFREFGSTPIVLVRPDGSKLYLENDAKDDSYTWYETDTYDMIALTDPMPGPWQAIGNILPESRIMVIANISLHANPIPNIVFSGETIKQEAYLKNGANKVDMSSFRDVVSLSIDLVSTNNPKFSNFGLGSRTIARFLDNGADYDEYEADGIFTGLYDLNVPEGEWKPVFTVRTPLFSREQITNNILLLPNPIKISHQISGTQDKQSSENEASPHLVFVDIERDHIDIESLIVDGSIRYPSGDVEKFSITEKSPVAKKIELKSLDIGIYKLSVNVYAQTKTGRDLVINAPDYSFITEATPVVPIPEVPKLDTHDSENVNLENDPSSINGLHETILVDDEFPIFLAIVVNLLILLFGSIVVVLLVDKRKHPNNHYILRIKSFIASKRGLKMAASDA